MGLGLDKQQIISSSLSTATIKIGSDSDNPLNIITVNNAQTVIAATQVLTTRVNFKRIGHNLTAGQQFNTTGFTPTTYNGTFTVDNVVDLDNVEIILLSDPGGDATVLGTYDDGTFDINLPGKFRIVDRVSDLNGTPINNQFTKSRSRIFSWVATFNIDHTAVGSDGNFIIIVDDTSIISIIQLPSNQILLPVYSNTEANFNTHIQIAGLIKSNGNVDVVEIGENSVNNNPYNLIRNIGRNIGVLNSLDNQIITSPINGTIQISTNVGNFFSGSQGGYIPTKGFNPNQFETVASSPTTIFTIDRASNGNIVNISTSLNVNQFESSPGVFASKGSSKASNNFIQTATVFNVELLGQITYSGGSRLTDAETANEFINIPNISILLPKITQISIENGATDLNNPAEAIFKSDIKQFR